MDEFYQQQAISPLASRENQAYLAITGYDPKGQPCNMIKKIFSKNFRAQFLGEINKNTFYVMIFIVKSELINMAHVGQGNNSRQESNP